MRMKLSIIFWFATFTLCTRALAVEFSDVEVAGKRFTICRVNIRKERLQLFLRDDTGMPLKSFEAIERWLQPRGQKLVFAMNAGMYHRDFSPVGLLVCGGQQLAPLNTANGEGNFFMKPNGVFVVTETGARIIDSSEYSHLPERVILAAQSGPLLLRKGKIHPAFSAKSESRLFRNGVGVQSPDVAVFAITEVPVNFYEFATMFRDMLHCQDALFFDGTISSLHSTYLKRSDKKIDLGPVIGVTE